jgi:hypothetical protein
MSSAPEIGSFRGMGKWRSCLPIWCLCSSGWGGKGRDPGRENSLTPSLLPDWVPITFCDRTSRRFAGGLSATPVADVASLTMVTNCG